VLESVRPADLFVKQALFVKQTLLVEQTSQGDQAEAEPARRRSRGESRTRMV